MNTQSQTTIQEELKKLADFYGLSEVPLLQNPDNLPLFEDYVEVVLAADHFELVLGGVGRERSLVALGQANALPAVVVEAFEACVAMFPDKMLYIKLPVGAPGQPGSMYVVVIEPWEKIQPFLQGWFPAPAVQAMRADAGRAEIAFILGFSLTENGELLAKVYHLFDRCAVAEPGKRFLVSHRLTAAGDTKPPKYYDARVQWAELATTGRWPDLVAFAQGLYGQRYALLSGHGAPGTTKVYVLRHDRRESHLFSHLTYNYYAEEGVKLVQCVKYEAALVAFANGLSFDPQDANAYNGLALTHVLAGNFLEGVACAFRARELNPTISNYIWHAPVPPGIAAEVARLSAELDEAPTADSFNQRGVQYFFNKQYAEAIADFQRAIALKDLHADAYNNLAGAYLKTGRFAEAVKMGHIARSISRDISPTNWEIARQAMQYTHELETGPTLALLNNLGVLYYQLDLYEAAHECFMQASQLLEPVALPSAQAV